MSHKAGGLSEDELVAAAKTATAEAVAAGHSHTLNNLKSHYLGRNSELQKRLHGIGQLPKEERAAAGVGLNRLRQALEAVFAEAQTALAKQQAGARLAAEALDVTLPGRRQTGGGSVHPVQQVINRSVAILSAIGFETAEGPEVESDYYNFAALNFAPDHPARAMHDTLYLADNKRLLRTHTSPVQIRFMEQNAGRLPIRAISPGKVFRRDSDATHSPMFHQIEGLWVDERVSFTDLKGVLRDFFRAFFEDDDIVVRFRPSFFPFTEPSAECDIRRGGDWLEIAGCGMVHPNVLAGADIDTERYQGFAFGMGVERLAMLYYGVDDIRLFFENDVRFLRQFGR